jgi:hypothetical protein
MISVTLKLKLLDLMDRAALAALQGACRGGLPRDPIRSNQGVPAPSHETA